MMLDPEWIAQNAPEFDVFHVQFGFDALSAGQLQAIVAALRAASKPLIYTVHDLRNPHHGEPDAHDRHLDILIPNADALITLTPGAADVIEQRWGRRPSVLPHPHVVPLSQFVARAQSRTERFVVGVHAKSVRASMDPLAVVRALHPLLDELAELELQVDVHHDVFDTSGARHDAELVGFLRTLSRHPSAKVAVHDYFTDNELWQYLRSLDVSVLPYRFGTHSGWLEACHDLGTTVIAPSCGYYTQQRRCLSYVHDEQHLDGDSLRQAVRTAYSERPVWQGTRKVRAAERDAVARAHAEIYRSVLR
jgi:glycosyltransferase involved in cell wall biosynthesis